VKIEMQFFSCQTLDVTSYILLTGAEWKKAQQ